MAGGSSFGRTYPREGEIAYAIADEFDELRRGADGKIETRAYLNGDGPSFAALAHTEAIEHGGEDRFYFSGKHPDGSGKTRLIRGAPLDVRTQAEKYGVPYSEKGVE